MRLLGCFRLMRKSAFGALLFVLGMLGVHPGFAIAQSVFEREVSIDDGSGFEIFRQDIWHEYYYPGLFRDYKYATWLCRDAPDYGTCDDAIDFEYARAGSTTITLPFRDGVGNSANLVLIAVKGMVSDNWVPIDQALNQTYGPLRADQSKHWDVRIRMAANQIAHLPHGGIWEGALYLRQFKGDETEGARPLDVKIRLRVTDANRAQLVFGEHHTANAALSIPLRAQSAPYTYAGRANLGMCLYDGFNGNSGKYTLTIKDAAGDAQSGYKLVHESGAAQAATPYLPLTVALTYQGESVEMVNGVTLALRKADSNTLRTVRLPSFPQPVRCATADLSLSIPEFNALTKEAGRYSTRLNLQFAASTRSP